MIKAAIECSPPEASTSTSDTGFFFLFELSIPTLSSLSCSALKLHVHWIMTNTSYFFNGVYVYALQLLVSNSFTDPWKKRLTFIFFFPCLILPDIEFSGQILAL